MAKQSSPRATLEWIVLGAVIVILILVVTSR